VSTVGTREGVDEGAGGVILGLSGFRQVRRSAVEALIQLGGEHGTHGIRKSSGVFDLDRSTEDRAPGVGMDPDGVDDLQDILARPCHLRLLAMAQGCRAGEATHGAGRPGC
jgi:hypothetical protein